MDQPRRPADPIGWQTRPSDATAPFAIRNGYVETADPGRPGVPGEAPDDLDLLTEVNRRPSRTTVLLIAGILASVAFVGGAIVQKNYGETGTGDSPGLAAGFGARAAGNAAGYGGFAGGGLPGAGPGGAQGGAAAGGDAAGAAGGAAGGTTEGTSGAGTVVAATPVVVGTVTKLSGSALTVKNLGGKSVKVTVPEGATITLVAGKSLTTLKTGATVSVAGATATNGTVTATSITVRS